jgi:dihydroorotate dehydrogenase (NAD+) catalytic subunit
LTLDLSTTVASVALPAPVLTASGTAGHGAELGAYGDLAALGAVVVKSLSASPWPGNAAPRVHGDGTGAWMLNSVGLQGPGVDAWRGDDLPAMVRAGARVVASIWGRTVDEYTKAAAALAGADVVAVEVNLSCPNLDGGRHMFAQSPGHAAEVVRAVVDAADGIPVWAKLTAACASIVEVADAVAEVGASAVVCVNTLLGMSIDASSRSYRLGSGAGGGGVSGPALHPVAVRAVHDVRAALPSMPIVGVGGVSSGVHAVELLLAGASAVEVGTATFADPRACWRVLDEVAEWCDVHGVRAVAELIGGVHGRSD